MVNPRNPLRYNTPRSAPPVSALAHSRGPRKKSQSPVDMLEHRDAYGQAQSVVRVIREVAGGAASGRGLARNCRALLAYSCDPYGILD